MPQSFLRAAAALSSFVCLLGIPATAFAQTRTLVTVRQTIRVPGAVLTPGQYEFSAIPGNVSAIEISSTARPRVMFIPVIPTNRMIRGGVLALYPTAPGAIDELASWYPDGGLSGFEFVSRRSDVDARSAQTPRAIDAQLAAADEAVADAHDALTAAKASRDVIRAERGRAQKALARP